MTNQNDENQLKKALEEGNLITVGQKTISEENEKELISIDSTFNKTFFKYNLPIGIDFAKSLKPYNFLISLEILDRILENPKISEKNRYKLENLRLYLTTGKIWHYKQELNVYLKEKNNKEEKELQSPYVISQNNFISLLTSLHFILNQASTTNVKWVSQTQILDLIESEDQKNILREWKTKNYNKLPEDAIFMSLISQTLIHKILLFNLPEDQQSELNDLKNLAIATKFSKILDIVTRKLNILSPLSLSSFEFANTTIDNEKSTQIPPDINNIIIYRILVTLYILLDE